MQARHHDALTVGTSPEVSLLLGCARVCYTTPDVAYLTRLLHANLDWTVVLQMGLRHCIIPLLYRTLHTVGTDAVPATVLDELQQHFHANTQRNLLLAGTLVKLLRLFTANQIAALPYKGPVLAVMAYGDLALRQFGDLDILVRTQDARRARTLLQAQGYQWWEDRPSTWFPRWRKVDELVSADRRVLVELHRAITSLTFYFPLDPACLWERPQVVEILHTPVHTMATEDLLLILCVHGAKHHWERFAWICDVAALLRAGRQIAWEQVCEQASRLGSKRMLWLGLWLAHTLLGATLPASIERQLHTDRAIPSLARQVYERLFIPSSTPLAAIDRPMFYLRLRERRRDQCRCACYLTYHMTRNRLS